MTDIQFNTLLKIVAIACIAVVFLSDVALSVWFYLSGQIVPTAITSGIWLGLTIAAHVLGVQTAQSSNMPVSSK